MRDLLEPVDKRPTSFYRGYDVFDPVNLGFITNVAEENGFKFFYFDTTLLGNSNAGHVYGTTLSADEKNALIEYIKKL